MATEKVKMFNSIIESLLAQTAEVVGTTYYTHFKQIIKINALLPINLSIRHILPYKDKIFERDESYFENEKNFLNEIDKVEKKDLLAPQEQIISEIFRMKDIYYKLNDESKDNIWNILQALIQLIIEYCEIKNISIV
jgi:hypothetical protein